LEIKYVWDFHLSHRFIRSGRGSEWNFIAVVSTRQVVAAKPVISDILIHF